MPALHANLKEACRRRSDVSLVKNHFEGPKDKRGFAGVVETDQRGFDWRPSPTTVTDG